MYQSQINCTYPLTETMSTKRYRILSALSGIIGVIMLITSFSLNPGPPSNATSAQLIAFGNQYFTSILWGAWLQAVGPLLIVLFAFAIVPLAGATTRLAGWMTLFGGTILMTVSLVEITFYMSARAFPNCQNWGKLTMDEASSLVMERQGSPNTSRCRTTTPRC